jgi:hypothetical protein
MWLGGRKIIIIKGTWKTPGNSRNSRNIRNSRKSRKSRNFATGNGTAREGNAGNLALYFINIRQPSAYHFVIFVSTRSIDVMLRNC